MAKISLELRPFGVPNYVTLVRPSTVESLPLASVDRHALSDMCEEFRREVFRKANQHDPRMSS